MCDKEDSHHYLILAYKETMEDGHLPQCFSILWAGHHCIIVLLILHKQWEPSEIDV